MAKDMSNTDSSHVVVDSAPSQEPANVVQDDIQKALAQAQDAVADIKHGVDESSVDDLPASILARQSGGAAVAMDDAPFVSAPDQTARTIELLGDVDLHVTVELGRTEMLVEDVLRLGGGSVVAMDKLAGDPVDVFVNNRLIARGEVLVLNDNFCIRISEIVADLEEQAAAAAQQLVVAQ
jgi:flagellar motor switch protein FliN/FliY